MICPRCNNLALIREADGCYCLQCGYREGGEPSPDSVLMEQADGVWLEVRPEQLAMQELLERRRASYKKGRGSKYE